MNEDFLLKWYLKFDRLFEAQTLEITPIYVKDYCI